jgi:hypothetical protein
MWTAAVVFAMLAGPAGAKVDLRPLRAVTVLPLDRCEVEVTFRLSVFDGGKEDYYCPRVIWEWEDGTRSTEESDCPPFDQAAPGDHRKTWLRRRDFQRAGSYVVKAYLCKADRRISAVQTTAIISGWDGYPPEQRQAFGCSPPRLAVGGTPADDDLPQPRPAQSLQPCS